MTTLATSSRWGTVSATIDPANLQSGVAISVQGADAQTLGQLTCGVFGGASPFRVLVFSGAIPGDVGQLTLWDAVNSIPANVAQVVSGITPLWEAIIPANSVLPVLFGASGPVGASGAPLTVLMVRMEDGNAGKSYVQLSAFPASAGNTGKDATSFDNARSVPRGFV